MMPTEDQGEEITLASLATRLDRLQANVAKERRHLADLLYNLEAENMPNIDARIRALEQRL